MNNYHNNTTFTPAHTPRYNAIWGCRYVCIPSFQGKWNTQRLRRVRTIAVVGFTFHRLPGVWFRNFLSELLFELLFANCSLDCVHKHSLTFWRTHSWTVREGPASKSVSHQKNLKIHLESLKALEEACKRPLKILIDLKLWSYLFANCWRINSRTGGLCKQEDCSRLRTRRPVRQLIHRLRKRTQTPEQFDDKAFGRGLVPRELITPYTSTDNIVDTKQGDMCKSPILFVKLRFVHLNSLWKNNSG